MENQVTYRVTIVRVEKEESEELDYKKVNEQGEYGYAKTGAKVWKEKENKTIYCQDFEKVDLKGIIKYLND